MKRRILFILLALIILLLITVACEQGLPPTANQVSSIKVDQADDVVSTEDYLPLVLNSLSPTPTAAYTVTPTPTPTTAHAVTLTPTRTHTPRTTRTPTPTGPSGVIQFVDGYGGDVNTAKDMLMSSNWSVNNGGAHSDFQFDSPPGAVQHAMLEFDLSSLPPEAVIQEAWLFLYHSYDAEPGPTANVEVYSVSAANADWIAGNKDIALAGAGEPCWNALAADGNGGVTTAWAGSAGCSTAGVDYEPGMIGSFTLVPGSPIGTEVRCSLDITRVQGWVGASNTNYGIILITTTGTGHVGSAENGTPAYRPKLVVYYTR